METEAGTGNVGRRLLQIFKNCGPDEFGQLSQDHFVKGLRRQFRVSEGDVRACASAPAACRAACGTSMTRMRDTFRPKSCSKPRT